MAQQAWPTQHDQHQGGQSSQQVKLASPRSTVTSSTFLMPLRTLDLVKQKIISRHGHILAAGRKEKPSMGV